MKAHESRKFDELAVNEWPMKQKDYKKLYEMKNPKSAQMDIGTSEVEQMKGLHLSR